MQTIRAFSWTIGCVYFVLLVGGCAVGPLVAADDAKDKTAPGEKKQSGKKEKKQSGKEKRPSDKEKPPSVSELVKGAEADRAAGEWEEAYTKLKKAAAQRPTDKKIADALTETSEYLADKYASSASGFCNQQELDKCEVEVKKALEYGRTPAAIEWSPG